MKIGIMGMGFVGGTAAEVFKKAHEIFAYDKYKEGYKCPEVLRDSEVVFSCVPTPMSPSGKIDLGPIHDSIETLEKVTSEYRRPLVVIRSTAVPGTTDQLARQHPFPFAFNPEFLREKHALEDMMNPDRIVIGAETDEDYNKVEGVYKILFPKVPYIHTNRRTAEMIKYFSNAILASNVSISNELFQICQVSDVNYKDVEKVLLMDPRMPRNMDVPGPDGDLGFGGKCFPKDLNALIHYAEENGYDPQFLKAILDLNKKVRRNQDWLGIKGATSENGFD